MARLQIVEAEAGHLEQAAALFSADYARLRLTVPALPARYERPDTLAHLLRRLHERHPMVAALQDGQLMGYLGGIRVPELKGRDRGVYCPEWGHSVAGSPAGAPAGAAATLDRRTIYNRMYEAIGETWIGEGRLNQAITILAHDRDTLDTWFWNGFGMLVVDVIRGVHPVESAPDSSIRVRAATLADVPRLLPVLQQHEVYYNRSPIWLPKTPMEDASELTGYLSDPDVTLWMAEEPGGEVVGFMKSQTGKADACQIVWDEESVACSGAYVLPRARRHGCGALLLAAIVDWAREHGFERVTLDFEAANIYGRAFWLRHFTPVCYSVLRHVNDKIGVPQPQE